jgi:exopolyphosphatase/guanosine-5'-triphosphate,3'-diphosphate pyrophosphatase
VDLGSNSVHLLVAGVRDHRLEPLVDESVFLGLGRAVDSNGQLGAEARAGLVDALVHYTEIARGLGATWITFIGTEPIRRAADAASVVHEVERATGVPLHVLTHEEEAYLTVVGVMAGRLVERETLIVDVGGGSSEFCLVGPADPPRAVGLKLGSDRLTARHVKGDPPSRPEVEAMIAEAATLLEGAPEAHPAEIVAVGGTASNLLKIVPEARIDLVLTRARIAEAMDILERETADEAVERHLVKPIRARILPAGAAIMDALMTRYGVSRIRVSDAGIREGAILVTAHVGVAWRDRLAELAHGWRT